MASRWLPVVDDLDRALQHPETIPRRIVDGVRAVRDETVRLVAELGFSGHGRVGEALDPARHDVPGRDRATGLLLQGCRYDRSGRCHGPCVLARAGQGQREELAHVRQVGDPFHLG
jgi:hypothetical protein